MGVKTCSTGCAKGSPPELSESQASAKRRKQKKAPGKRNIEASASMTLRKEDLGDDSYSRTNGDGLVASGRPSAAGKSVDGGDRRPSAPQRPIKDDRGKGQDELSDDQILVDRPEPGDYTARMLEGMKPRTLIICLGRREAGLDLHVPNIANSLDLEVVQSRDILQRAMSALSDGPSLETRAQIKTGVTNGELVDD